MAKIILAEDETVTAILFKKKLERMNHEILAIAKSSQEVIDLAALYNPDIIFMDINLKFRSDGILACKEIKARNDSIKVVFLSAYEEFMFEKELQDCCYDGFIDKYLFEFKVREYL